MGALADSDLTGSGREKGKGHRTVAFTYMRSWPCAPKARIIGRKIPPRKLSIDLEDDEFARGVDPEFCRAQAAKSDQLKRLAFFLPCTGQAAVSN